MKVGGAANRIKRQLEENISVFLANCFRHMKTICGKVLVTYKNNLYKSACEE